MEIIARLIELKPDSADRVREWAGHIDAHRERALSATCSLTCHLLGNSNLAC